MANTKSNKGLIIGAGILVLLVLLLAGYVSMRNKLVMMEEDINAAWAQVENQLQRRYDLIPNLVETVKGYASQEREIFTNIANARAQLAGARSIPDKINASQQMESALSRLLVIVENYPNLKSDQNFRRLMDSLEGTENRIAVERRRYNDTVSRFNRTVRSVPYNFIAGSMGFETKPYFEMEEAAATAPKVTF